MAEGLQVIDWIGLAAEKEDVTVMRGRFPVDVKNISSERFDATKNVIGGIAYPAHKYGRVVYDAA